jgi:hypothetical protein
VSRALALVIALYAIWRAAVVMGRRRDAARAASFPFAGTVAARRCSRCGRIAVEDEMVARGHWARRTWTCRGACVAGGAEERSDASR